jgi:hypothetical protein
MPTTKTTAETKTCQICGRGIKMVRGHIAHHGYQRPGEGWQTASCYGARALPFEVSCDLLRGYVERLATSIEEQRAAMLAPVATLSVVVERKYNRNTGKSESTFGDVTEATLADMLAAHPYMAGRNGAPMYSGLVVTWSTLVARHRKAQAAHLEQSEAYYAHQSRRLAAWVTPA